VELWTDDRARAEAAGHHLRKHFGEGALVPTGAVRAAIEARPKPIAQDAVVKKDGFRVVRLIGERDQKGLRRLARQDCSEAGCTASDL
jgi:hypothetical protein